MKEMKLEIPADCEVDKIETQDGQIVITLKEKERKLPKSWEEFCEMFPIKKGECSIGAHSDVIEEEKEFCRKPLRDRNVYPDRDTSEAVLALCQLIQLRNAYNGDFKVNWIDTKQHKYVIGFDCGGDIKSDCYIGQCITHLFFKSEELRDEFLRNFRPLIEKLKPLYGIKEGGEE